MLNPSKIFLQLFLLATGLVSAQQLIRGSIVDKDSSTVLPFVYIINKSNGNGTMSDNDGKFTLNTTTNDTLICSYVGYAKQYIPVNTLKPGAKGEVKLVMTQAYINLTPVTISTFRIKPYERAYMNDIIERSKIKTMDYANSPISALYARYSKEGRQVNKLARIFEQILIEEQVQKKLSREILTRLTGDDKIDYEAFRKYCYYVNDYYIVSHEGVDLYSKVMECYKKWKSETRVQR